MFDDSFLEMDYEDRNGYPDEEIGYDEDFPEYLEWPDDEPMFPHSDGFVYGYEEEM